MMPGLLALATGLFQPAPCGLAEVSPDFERQQRVECGWVTVPRGADGRSLRLWAARLRATGTEPRPDPILYIHGGPGIATVDAMLPSLPTNRTLAMLRRERDIILFDQRGSGRSEEALCPDLGRTLSELAAQNLAPEVEEDRGRAAFVGCREDLERAGIDLGAYTTAATVRDIAVLRRAFGVRQWNLLSISYGTLVAMQAMRSDPESIRSLVLNSPFPPNSVTWAEQASSAAAAYAAIDRECALQPECRERFGTLLPKLEALLARLEREPLADGTKRINGRQFARALWPLAVRTSTVRFVPVAIHRAHAGDAELIRAMVRTFASGDSFGGYSPAQGTAISCFESGRTREWYARARALYPALVPATPDDSWDRTCAAFRPGYADPAFFAPVASDIPTLIYAGTLDPATPVIDAYQAMRFLTKAHLVEVRAASHGPLGLSDCTRSIAAAFLDRPDATPDRSCLDDAPPPPFATEGIEALLGGETG